MYRYFYIILIGFFVLSSCSVNKHATNSDVRDFLVKEIQFADIGNHKANVEYKKINNDVLHVQVSWQLSENVQQDDVAISITPDFIPNFHWAPHLTPQNNYIIAQHVFRAPAIIYSNETKCLSVIPDLDMLSKGSPVEWYADNNALENKITLGMSKSRVQEHVLFVKNNGAVYPKGKIEFGFYIITEKNQRIVNPWRKSLSFMWQKWGEPLYKKGEPLGNKDINQYVAQTYQWAFDTWKKPVWQQFELNNQQVGAPSFIVNITQSPNYPGHWRDREVRSIWNQAWFSSLRSASGLYKYAKATGNKAYENYALMTKGLALSMPQNNGIFPSVILTEMEEVEIDGQKYSRSKGWNTAHFGNSNRNPYTWNMKESPYHLLDMSFTAFHMLRWYEELEKDNRLIEYTKRYADRLITLQQQDGFFPGWLSLDKQMPLQHLNQSPETSMSVAFLLKLYSITKENKYLLSAQKAMNAVVDNIVYSGKWEDFETYWSCSRYGSDTLVGKKVIRNNQYKQNTLSMYWTALALMEMYRVNADKKYLQTGQRVLDEMLMYQATWQPPFIAVRALGGFGVMNADGEWNDSRQSLFAPLIMEYGKILNNQEYQQRAKAALDAAFTMMYTPLNPSTMQQWQQRYPFFGKEDYGFMMENYGHEGVSNDKGLGIGEFTIYDWGNGAAAEAYMFMESDLKTR